MAQRNLYSFNGQYSMPSTGRSHNIFRSCQVQLQIIGSHHAKEKSTETAKFRNCCIIYTEEDLFHSVRPLKSGYNLMMLFVNKAIDSSFHSGELSNNCSNSDVSPWIRNSDKENEGMRPTTRTARSTKITLAVWL